MLYAETPMHGDNFIELSEQGYYDGMLFHRVIKGFMIQTGDPNTKKSKVEAAGDHGPGYTIQPSSILPCIIRKEYWPLQGRETR